MGKRRGLLSGIDQSMKRKANNASTQAIYELMWGEKPSKGHRRAGGSKK